MCMHHLTELGRLAGVPARRLHYCILMWHATADMACGMRRECEMYARELTKQGGKLVFNSDEKQASVDEVFKNAVSSLSEVRKGVLDLLPEHIKRSGAYSERRKGTE